MPPFCSHCCRAVGAGCAVYAAQPETATASSSILETTRAKVLIGSPPGGKRRRNAAARKGVPPEDSLAGAEGGTRTSTPLRAHDPESHDEGTADEVVSRNRLIGRTCVQDSGGLSALSDPQNTRSTSQHVTGSTTQSPPRQPEPIPCASLGGRQKGRPDREIKFHRPGHPTPPILLPTIAERHRVR